MEKYVGNTDKIKTVLLNRHPTCCLCQNKNDKKNVIFVFRGKKFSCVMDLNLVREFFSDSTFY